MKETIEVVNAMVADGVINGYAIGGAVGATFYLEPAATLDIDIFITFETSPDSSLLTLSPIYSYLVARGYSMEGEYIVIGNWPVQFLPAGDALVEEALTDAVDADVAGVKTRVMTAEHLAAIALRLGRSKDYVRLLQFIESDVLDSASFDRILTTHKLGDIWDQFCERFLDQS